MKAVVGGTIIMIGEEGVRREEEEGFEDGEEQSECFSSNV